MLGISPKCDQHGLLVLHTCLVLCPLCTRLEHDTVPANQPWPSHTRRATATGSPRRWSPMRCVRETIMVCCLPTLSPPHLSICFALINTQGYSGDNHSIGILVWLDMIFCWFGRVMGAGRCIFALPPERAKTKKEARRFAQSSQRTKRRVFSEVVQGVSPAQLTLVSTWKI